MNIFVYGTLKRNKYNHYLMAGYKSMKHGYVRGYKIYTNGLFPMVVAGLENDIVKGELYSFEKNEKIILKKLDMLEGYSGDEFDLYKRKNEKIILKNKEVEAFIYIYNLDILENHQLLKNNF